MGVEILETVELADGLQDDSKNMKPNQKEEADELGVLSLEDGGRLDGANSVEAGPAPIPKDAMDEWPAPKPMHQFYFVRFRFHEDTSLKEKIDHADKELQKKNQVRFHITEALRAKRSERADLISQLKPLSEEDKKCKVIVDEKRKNMEPLQAALGKIRSANNTVREKGIGLYSSEEELNEVLQSLHYRMQHESNTLNEEKQLLKEIKLLEATRERVIANVAIKARLQDSLIQKEVIHDKLGIIGGDLDGIRKEQAAIRSKIQPLEEKLKSVNADIEDLQKNLKAETEKRDKAYERLISLRKQREEGNACFYENRMVLNKAKDLASRKDIAMLEELSVLEMDKFMSLWCGSKAYRDDYVMRIRPSLDIRQLSRDGRMRNHDEKPLMAEASIVVEDHTSAMKVTGRKTQLDATSFHTLSSKEIARQRDDEQKKIEPSVVTEISVGQEQVEMATTAVNGIDALTVKEMKRAEEKEKAKRALERKQKIAEKAAAKAASRAQKDAEKKLKEREKRAKKRAGGLNYVNDAVLVEAVHEVEDLASKEANDRNPVVTNAGKRENIRRRNQSSYLRPSLRGALRRRKSSYWIWAISFACMLALVLATVAYICFL